MVARETPSTLAMSRALSPCSLSWRALAAATSVMRLVFKTSDRVVEPGSAHADSEMFQSHQPIVFEKGGSPSGSGSGNLLLIGCGLAWHYGAGRGPGSMSSYGTGIGACELPDAIDEQFCGAGWPAKRRVIQAIEFVSQITMLATWPSASYCS